MTAASFDHRGGEAEMRLRSTAGVAHLAVLTVSAVALFLLTRHQWFYGDEWDFLVRRGLVGAELGVFEPHNEHWSTIPILVYRALFAAFGVRSYAPYIGVLILLHITAVHLLWRIMLRSGVGTGIATASTAAFAIIGAGSENLLWAFQIGFVGSVAAGFAGVLLATGNSRRATSVPALWTIGVVALAFSGIGVTMVAAMALAVMLRRGWRDGVIAAAGPAVAYLSWLAFIGSVGLGSHDPSIDGVLQTPAFLWTGLAGALDAFLGGAGFGALAAAAVLVWSIRSLPERALAAPVALTASAIPLYVIAGVGRASLGLSQATTGRYVYVGVALLLPALSCLLATLTGTHVGRRTAVVALLLLVVMHNFGTLKSAASTEATREKRIREQILAAANLVVADAPTLDPYPEQTSPDLTVDALRALVRHGSVPTADALGEAAELEAVLALQVAVSELPRVEAAGPAAVVDGSARREPRAKHGCAVAHAAAGADQLLVDVPSPTAVAFIPEASGEIEVHVRSRKTGATSSGRVFAVAGGRTTHLSLAAPMSILVTLTPGSTTLCGIAP